MRVVSVWLCVKDRKQEKIECNRMSVCYGLRVRGSMRVVCEKRIGACSTRLDVSNRENEREVKSVCVCEREREREKERERANWEQSLQRQSKDFNLISVEQHLQSLFVENESNLVERKNPFELKTFFCVYVCGYRM